MQLDDILAPRLPVHVHLGQVSETVSVRAICALSVEFHVQRLGYMRPRSYRYVFDAGPNKHDNIDWIIALAEISTETGAVLAWRRNEVHRNTPATSSLRRLSLNAQPSR